MTKPQQKALPIDGTFEWPESKAPSSSNLTLASKLCATLLPVTSNPVIVTTHFPSGWSSNDVIKVSIYAPGHRHRFVVKLPRRQDSSTAPASREVEALRTSWAADHGFGPKVLAIDEASGSFVMDYLEGQPLTAEMISQRLPQAVQLLRRIHGTEAAPWMRRYDPMMVTKDHLKRIEECNSMHFRDIRLVESIIRNTEEQVEGHPWVPCHNDFHSHNIMLARSSSDDNERLLAIDFEDCDLGDPMWDIAYLMVNLELEREPFVLGDLYGASAEDKRRIRAYVPLAMAHCATWAALHGGVWAQHQREVIVRLREVVIDLS